MTYNVINAKTIPADTSILHFNNLANLQQANSAFQTWTVNELAKYFNVTETIIVDFAKMFNLTYDDVAVKEDQLVFTESFKKKLSTKLLKG